MSKYIFMAYDSGGIKMNDKMLEATKNSLVFDFSRNSIYTQGNEFGYTGVVYKEVPASQLSAENRKLITNVYKTLEGEIGVVYTSIGTGDSDGLVGGVELEDIPVTGPTTYANIISNITQDSLGQIGYTYTRIYTGHSTESGIENNSGSYSINGVHLSEDGKLTYSFIDLTLNTGTKTNTTVLGKDNTNSINVVTGISSTADGKITYSYSDISTYHYSTGLEELNYDNGKRVITNTYLSEDGHLSYTYQNVTINNDTPKYEEATQLSIDDANVSVKNISTTTPNNQGTRVVSDVKLLQGQSLTIGLKYSYSYIYADNSHHSTEIGNELDPIYITSDGTPLLSGAYLSPDGKLSYSYSNYIVRNSTYAEVLSYLDSTLVNHDENLSSVVDIYKDPVTGRLIVEKVNFETVAGNLDEVRHNDVSYFDVIDNIYQFKDGKISYTSKRIVNTHTYNGTNSRGNHIINNVNIDSYGNLTYTYYDASTNSGVFTNTNQKYSSHHTAISGVDVPVTYIPISIEDSISLVNGIKQEADGKISYSYISLYGDTNLFTKHIFNLNNYREYGADELEDNTVKVVYLMNNNGANNQINNESYLNYSTAEVPTKHYIDNLISTNDALRYCGTLTASNEENGSVTLNYNAVNTAGFDSSNPDTQRGAVYKVSNTGYFGTEKVCAGDMVISNSDSNPNTSTITVFSGWDAINENIDLRQSSNRNENSLENNLVITSVHLSADGELSYTYYPSTISAEEDTDWSTGESLRILPNIVSTFDINTNSTGNIGLPVITSISAENNGLEHIVKFKATYIYSSQNHHSSTGTRNSNGAQVISNINLSNDGQLTYTYNTETAITYSGALEKVNLPETKALDIVNILHRDEALEKNIGYNLITGIKLERKENEISLSYTYTSIYASQNHHSTIVEQNVADVILSSTGTKLVNEVNLSSDGTLYIAKSNIILADAGTVSSIGAKELSSYTHSVVNIYKDPENNGIVTYSYVNLTTEEGTLNGEVTIREETPLNIITGLTQRGDGKITYSYQKVNIASLWERGEGENSVKVVNSGSNNYSSYSISAGYMLTATGATGESVFGQYNFNNENVGLKTIHTIGIGYYNFVDSTEVRQNAIEILTNGDFYLYGVGNYDGTNSNNENSISLQQYFQNKEYVISSALNDLHNKDIDLQNQIDSIPLVWERGTGELSVQTRGTNCQALAPYSVAEGILTLTNSEAIYSHVEGEKTYTVGRASHAEGQLSYSYGVGSHAEGIQTYAVADGSHTEGTYTIASGISSHTEGAYTYAVGNYSHAEGINNISIGIASHSEGNNNRIYGENSHGEGNNNYLNGETSHIEGGFNIILSNYSHAEGYNTKVYKNYGHSEGNSTTVNGLGGHAEGLISSSYGNYSHAEGNSYSIGNYSHAEGKSSTYSLYSHSEGLYAKAYGEASHAEGKGINISTIGTTNNINDTTITINAVPSLNLNKLLGAKISYSENWFEYTGAIWNHEVVETVIINEEVTNITINKSERLNFDNIKQYIFTEEEITSSNIRNYNQYLSYNSLYGEPSLYGILHNSTNDANILSATFLNNTYTLSLSNGINPQLKLNNDNVIIFKYSTSGNYSHAEGLETQANGNNSHAEGYESISNGINSHAEGNTTYSYGDNSHTEGAYTYTFGLSSHAEGWNTYTYGDYSHSEGIKTTVGGNEYRFENNDNYNTNDLILFTPGSFGHAEGAYTWAYGPIGAHAEGNKTKALGYSTHAEGNQTIAYGNYSHTEGYKTLTYNDISHAEGRMSMSYGKISHAEGLYTYSFGDCSHSQGEYSIAYGRTSHAEGKSVAIGKVSHSEGDGVFEINVTGPENSIEYTATITDTDEIKIFNLIGKDNYDKLYTYSFIYPNNYRSTDYNRYITEFSANLNGDIINISFKTNQTLSTNNSSIGNLTSLNNYKCYICHIIAYGNYSHTEGVATIAYGDYSHAEGHDNKAIGIRSHVEGLRTIASGASSHAEGNETQAIGAGSHAEGLRTISGATGKDYTHAEGTETEAIGLNSHSEGQNTHAIGANSHAEGVGTYAYLRAHSEGHQTHAEGENSHAEGRRTWAIGKNSHAEGWGTYAYNLSEHAEGQFNLSHTAYGGGTNWHGNSDIDGGELTVSSVGIGNQYYDNELNEQVTIQKNAIEIMQNGDFYLYGIGDYDGTNPDNAITLQAYLTTAGVWQRGNGELSVQTKETNSYAEGDYSVASGRFTYAYNTSETALGQYNISNIFPEESFGYAYNTIYSIGIGTSEETRKNAVEVTQSGELYLLGIGDYDGTNIQSAYSLKEVIIEDELIISYAFNDLDQRIDIIDYKLDSMPEPVFQKGTGLMSIVATESGSTSIGTYTFTVGENSHTAGVHSVTIGSYSNTENPNSATIGNYSHTSASESFTIGNYSNATGANDTIALGNYNTNMGSKAVNIGLRNYNTGNNSSTIGYFNSSYSTNALIFGNNAYIDSNSISAVSIGYLNSLNNSANTFILGYNSTSNNGNYSVLLGIRNTNNAQYSSVIGNNNTNDSNNGINIGNRNTTSGDNTIAIGNYIITNSSDEIGIGKYNFSSGNVFELGIGTSDSDRKNAFEVNNEGELYLFGIGEYTGNNAANSKSLQLYLEENERTISEALNDLNDRILDLKDEISSLNSSPFEYGSANKSIQSFGTDSIALGEYSFAEGSNTIANNNYEIALGFFNVSNINSDTFGDEFNTAFSLGIGTSDSNRKNAFEIMQNGDLYIYGVGDYDGTNVNVPVGDDSRKKAISLQEYFEDKEYVISSALNELNSRLLTLESDDFNLTNSLDDDGNDVISITINGVTKSITLLNAWSRMHAITN